MSGSTQSLIYFQSLVQQNSLSTYWFDIRTVRFGPMNFVDPFLCFSFGFTILTNSLTFPFPVFSRLQICSRSSVCFISLPLRALFTSSNFWIDLFVPAAFTIILRKNQRLARKETSAILSNDYKAADFSKPLFRCSVPPRWWEMGVLITSRGGTSAWHVSIPVPAQQMEGPMSWLK